MRFGILCGNFLRWEGDGSKTSTLSGNLGSGRVRALVQYSSASMIVRTRAVEVGSAGSTEATYAPASLLRFSPSNDPTAVALRLGPSSRNAFWPRNMPLAPRPFLPQGSQKRRRAVRRSGFLRSARPLASTARHRASPRFAAHAADCRVVRLTSSAVTGSGSGDRAVSA